MYVLIQCQVWVSKGRVLDLCNITIQILSCRTDTQTSEEIVLCLCVICQGGGKC